MGGLADLEYEEARAWLKQRGGTWRIDPISDEGGYMVVARVEEAKGRSFAPDDSEEAFRSALAKAINLVRGVLSDSLIKAVERDDGSPQDERLKQEA